MNKQTNIVTAFIPGGSLFDYIHSNEKITRTTELKIIKGITSGMMHLEAEGKKINKHE